MAYFQDSEDPYGSYDPQAPLDPYVTQEDSFEFYDEGSDPYGEDGLYLSDGVDEYPDDELGYDEYDDELYEEEGDGMMYDDDILFQDDWLPLPPEEIPIETLPFEERPEDYGSQLLIGGLQHPDPASMRDSYCQFYPEACLEGAGLSGREPFNRTEVAEELDRTLKDIDMTGLAIAAVLILILLFGLHYGGATETPAPATPPSPKDKIRSRLKAADYVDPELGKRVDDVMKLSEDKREPEMDRLSKKQYEKKLKEAGVKEPKLAEDLAAIMKTPEKEREAKFKALTGTAAPSSSDPDKLDKKKFDDLLKAAGVRGPERALKLKDVMNLPADKRQAKCDEIIAALKPSAEAPKSETPKPSTEVPKSDKPKPSTEVPKSEKPGSVAVDPERASYQKRLAAKGIKEPDLTKKLDEIMAVPSGADRESKYKDLTKPPSTSAAPDQAADRAKYKQQLEASGIKEPRLTRKLDEVMKGPAAKREAKCKAIIDADKAAAKPDAEKPLTPEKLDAELKKYIPDDAQRAAAVSSLSKKSLADQTRKIGEYKDAKEKSDKKKEEKEAKKKELTTKLQDAGVKDPKPLEAEVKRLTPMSAADQATEIGKIKAKNDAKKASDADQVAKDKLRAALDTELKEAGYKDDKDRAKRVDRLMGLEWAERDAKKKEYVDALKNLGKGEPSDESKAATKAAEEAEKAAAKAALRAELEAALKGAGYTDQTRIDEMVKTLMAMPDKTKRDAKLEDYKSRAPKAKPPSSETPEQKTAKKNEDEAAVRAELDKKLLDAKYTDKADRDAKVDKLMNIKDPAIRDSTLKQYLARKPGSSGGPPATVEAPKPSDPAVPPGNGTKELDKAEIERQLKEKGFKDPKAIKYMTDEVLAKSTPSERATKLKTFTGMKDAEVGPADERYAKRQEDIDKAAAGVVPVANTPETPPSPDAEFKQKLKDLGYSTPAVENMMTRYAASTPDQKKKLSDTLLTNDIAKQKANEDKYKGKVEPGATKAPKTEDEFKEALVKVGYKEPAIEEMMKAYKAAGTDEAKKALSDKLLTNSNTKRRANQKEYSALAAGDTPAVVAAHRDTMDKLLSDAGFDDKDAREEIIDKIYSEGGTPQEQIQKLENDFTKRSEPTRKKLNTEYGDKRRKDAAAALGPDGNPVVDPSAPLTGLPSDDEILEALKAAGWSDPHARQHLLSRIKDSKKSPVEQLKSYKNYAKAGAGTDELNKLHGDNWRKKHPAGTDPTTNPSKPTTLPDDGQILKDLEAAKWTDPDARKYLLDRIKNKGLDGKADLPNKPAADQLRDYKKYTAPNTASPDLNAQYGKRWRDAHPADPEMTAEEKELDKELAKRGYNDDARRKMLSELRDPKNKDKKQKMMKDWMDPKADVDATNKKKGNEQAAIDVANDARKRGIDPNAKAPKGTPSDPNTKSPKSSTIGGESGGSSESWLSGPQLMLLGLLLIPIFLVLSRGMTTPSGQSMLRMPTMPTMPALRGPWSSSPIMAGGIPVSTGLPELASKRKTKTRKSASSIPRMAVSHEKGGSRGSVPAININNVNAQGRDIPINIDSGSGGSGGILGAVMEEVVTTEETTVEETVISGATEQVVVEEKVAVVEETPIITVIEEEEEAITIELQGPSDPNRLFWMVVCLIIISIPLLFDHSSDGPERTLSENEYLSAMYHWIVLAVAILFIFLRLDRAYHWTTRYGRPLVRVTRRLPGMITPAIVGTVEGTERLIWGVDDAVFGKSQEMLGLVLASAVFLVAAMSDPHDALDKGEYTEGSWQFMPLLAIGFVTFLFHNASASVY